MDNELLEKRKKWRKRFEALVGIEKERVALAEEHRDAMEHLRSVTARLVELDVRWNASMEAAKRLRETAPPLVVSKVLEAKIAEVYQHCEACRNAASPHIKARVKEFEKELEVLYTRRSEIAELALEVDGGENMDVKSEMEAAVFLGFEEEEKPKGKKKAS